MIPIIWLLTRCHFLLIDLINLIFFWNQHLILVPTHYCQVCAYKYLEFEIKFISNGVGCCVLSTESNKWSFTLCQTCHKLVIGENMPELSSIKLFQLNILQYVRPILKHKEENLFIIQYLPSKNLSLCERATRWPKLSLTYLLQGKNLFVTRQRLFVTWNKLFVKWPKLFIMWQKYSLCGKRLMLYGKRHQSCGKSYLSWDKHYSFE